MNFSPLVGLGTWVFVVRQEAFKTNLSKWVKHEKTCYDNQHAFVLFGFLTPDVVDILQKVQRIMHNKYSRGLILPSKNISDVAYCMLVYHLCISYYKLIEYKIEIII